MTGINDHPLAYSCARGSTMAYLRGFVARFDWGQRRGNGSAFLWAKCIAQYGHILESNYLNSRVLT